MTDISQQDKYHEMYHRHLGNSKTIAKIRNDLLKKRHPNLPSYCYWTSDDLANETVEDRKKWIKEFAEEVHQSQVK